MRLSLTGVLERHPDLKIIWGGYFPTQHPEPCLRSGCVDFVVRGCGEYAFEALVGALRSGGDVSEIRCLFLACRCLFIRCRLRTTGHEKTCNK